tara:strand:+ start:232 stop:651 length:420 start_codon:yes stop_codon:yes gene_type:complete
MSEKIKVNEDFVKSLISGAAWRETEVSKPIVEETETAEAEEEVVVEEETHTCPLCESSLSEELSEEAMDAHIDMLQLIVNEDEEAVEEMYEDDDEDEDEKPEATEKDDDSEMTPKEKAMAAIKKKLGKKAKGKKEKAPA